MNYEGIENESKTMLINFKTGNVKPFLENEDKGMKADNPVDLEDCLEPEKSIEPENPVEFENPVESENLVELKKIFEPET